MEHSKGVAKGHPLPPFVGRSRVERTEPYVLYNKFHSGVIVKNRRPVLKDIINILLKSTLFSVNVCSGQASSSNQSINTGPWKEGRKCQRGRAIPEKWIFGGYDETLKIGFIQMVPNRAAATLLPIIQERIEDTSIAPLFGRISGQRTRELELCPTTITTTPSITPCSSRTQSPIPAHARPPFAAHPPLCRSPLPSLLLRPSSHSSSLPSIDKERASEHLCVQTFTEKLISRSFWENIDFILKYWSPTLNNHLIRYSCCRTDDLAHVLVSCVSIAFAPPLPYQLDLLYWSPSPFTHLSAPPLTYPVIVTSSFGIEQNSKKNSLRRSSRWFRRCMWAGQ